MAKSISWNVSRFRKMHRHWLYFLMATLLCCLLSFPVKLFAASIQVTTTSDSGPGSLRETLELSAGNAEDDTIHFAIPTADAGYDAANDVWIITPLITFVVPPGTTIDGRHVTEENVRAGIEIDGTILGQAGMTGFYLYENTSLLGLVINRCQYGIWIASSHATVEHCCIGTDPSGTIARPNGADGILLANGATGAVIQGNLISGNSGSGIRLFGEETAGNLIRDNRIGTDGEGASALANRIDGIDVSNGAHGTIIENNLCSGNVGIGIHLLGAGVVGNTIIGNRIGTDAGGTKALPNGSFGVALYDGASNNVVGPENIIAYNALDGVLVDGAFSFTSTVGNTITANSVYANERLGILLFRGGNGEIAAPSDLTCTPAQISGSAGAGETIEVFCDAGRQGKLFLGSTTTDLDGRFVFSLPAPLPLPFVTITVTDAAGNTSGFSSPLSTEIAMPRQSDRDYHLSQNYPNPCNPSTTIEFTLPTPSFVTLKVYNLRGEQVATLLSQQREAGVQQVMWNAGGLASGAYLYRLQAGEFISSKKLVIMR